MLDVYLLGEGGMMPLPGRWLSSALVRYGGRLLLFDCGEGTQIPLRAAGWGLRAMAPFLISPNHGAHVGGRLGLWLTRAIPERGDPLAVYAPPALRRAVEGLR